MHLRLRLLLACLEVTSMSPGSEDVEDVAFIATTFENLVDIKGGSITNLNGHSGIRNLGYQDFLGLPPPRTAAISGVNLVTGSHSYCAAASKIILFGEALAIHQKMSFQTSRL